MEIINGKEVHLIEYNLQWFAKDGPGGEKTEPATEKKLREAREEGKVARSKELTAALNLIVLFLCLKIFVGYVGERLAGIFSVFYGRIPEVLSESGGIFTLTATKNLMNQVIINIVLVVIPFMLIGLVVGVLVNVLQVGWKVTTKPMKPELSKFNPLNGFKRMFSKDSLFELFMAVVKIALICYVAYSSIKDHQSELFLIYDIELKQAIALIGDIIINTGLKIAFVYLIVGIVDFIYNKHKFSEDMKMTKQEVKDEYKNTEGDPQIKGRQRQRMREASQRRMMQDVPKADVVITNPTHYAVAIQYDSSVAKAPVVLAKGEDFLAQKIKEVARENHIEIVENKPLARMLYANVNVGAEIPPELYQAVAEVLAMVYNLKDKGY
ncbi:MAG: flagellar biosynthesis protein FlhB [Roseburia sp.]